MHRVNIDALRFHVSVALFSFRDLCTLSKHFTLKSIVHHNLVIDSVVSPPNVELCKLINNELCTEHNGETRRDVFRYACHVQTLFSDEHTERETCFGMHGDVTIVTIRSHFYLHVLRDIQILHSRF